MVNEYRSPRLGPGGAFIWSVGETVGTVKMMGIGISSLFKGANIVNAFGGPPRLVWEIGNAAVSGFSLGFGPGVVTFFRFISFLSIVLFLMNILPIPAADGGQIILFIVELVRGKPAQPRTVARYQYIGFSILIALLIFFSFNDILYFLRLR
jgi:regulator of sigma E protease